jgi:hypothetical protein
LDHADYGVHSGEQARVSTHASAELFAGVVDQHYQTANRCPQGFCIRNDGAHVLGRILVCFRGCAVEGV